MKDYVMKFEAWLKSEERKNSVYLLAYDLKEGTDDENEEESNHKSVKKYLEEECGYETKYILNTTFLIKTSDSIYNVKQKITERFDSNDRFILTEIKRPPRVSNLKSKVLNWIISE